MSTATIDVPQTQPKYDFDLFISYADEDEQWCMDQLIGPLDRLTVHHRRNFAPGQTWQQAEDDAVKRSRYVLVVLSEAWVTSKRDIFIADRVKLARLIPILFNPCQPEERIANLVPIDMSDPAKYSLGLAAIKELVEIPPSDLDDIVIGLDALRQLLRRFRRARDVFSSLRLLFDPAARRIEVINDFKRIHDDFQKLDGTFRRNYDVLPLPVPGSAAPTLLLTDALEAQVETLAAQSDSLLDTARDTTFLDFEMQWARNLQRIRQDFTQVLNGQVDKLPLALFRLQIILGSEPVKINSRIVEGIRALGLGEVTDGLRKVHESIAGYRLTEDAQKWYEQFRESVEGLYRMAAQINALVANHNWFQGVDDTLRPFERERRPSPVFVAALWDDVVSPLSYLDPSAGDRVPKVLSLAKDIEAILRSPPTEQDVVRKFHRLFNDFRNEMDLAFNRTDVDLKDLCADLRRVGQEIGNLLEGV